MQYESILNTVKTNEDRVLLLDELRLLLDSSYKEGENDFENTLKSQVRIQISTLLTEALEKVNDRGAYLRGLVNILEEAEVVEVKLSYSPSERTINKIYDWLYKNLGYFLTIDFKYDPEIIAGLTLTYKGKFLDLSYKARFEEYFSKNYTNIKSLLK